MNTTESPVFSVSEFIEYINLAVGRRVVVEGEISSYSVNHGKWIFFDLKDENSKVSCFAAAWNLHTALEDGMRVQIVGVPRVYGKNGKFSITVESVELKGSGSLKRALELTKAKLSAEGLFDVGRKRPIAIFPEKIGLICSSESAAYTDFMRIVNQRWGGLDVHLAHVHVQGDLAVQEIVGAFEWFNENGSEEGIETLVMIRGGGSLEDLQAFNSEAVARAVFGSRIPVVCGVGHERDESLADYVADIRAATPTHAAALVVPDRQEMSDAVHSVVRSLHQCVEHELDWHKSGVERSVLSLQHAISGMIHHCKHLFGQFAFALSAREATVSAYRERISHAASFLSRSLEQSSQRASSSLAALERTLQNMSPLKVLKRGYSIVERSGRAITSKAQLTPGATVELRFSDGRIGATVDSPQGKLL